MTTSEPDSGIGPTLCLSASRNRRARQTQNPVEASQSVIDFATDIDSSVAAPCLLTDFLHEHVLTLDARQNYGFLHRISAERLAKLLIEDHFDKCSDSISLRVASLL